MVMYWVKQVVSILTAPLVFSLMLAAIAVVVRWLRWPRVARWLGGGSLVLAYVCSTTLAGDALLGRLERQYPPLQDSQLGAPLKYVVVLGSGYQPRDGLPVTAALDQEGVVRVVEGVRLARRLPQSLLVLSGGAPPPSAPSAHGYEKLALELGFARENLLVLDESLDTGDEALSLPSVVGRAPFVLVTSASHMPRSVRLMRQAGLAPLPAPTGHRVTRRGSGLKSLLPSASGLRKTELAVHEYLGLAAMTLGVT